MVASPKKTSLGTGLISGQKLFADVALVTIANNASLLPFGYKVDRPEITPYQARRDSKFALRELARRITTLRRVGNCGCARIDASERVEAKRKEDDKGNIVAYWGNVQTCGSIWCCVVCAAKVRQKRAEEISEILKRHNESGGFAYTQLLTVPHKASDTITESTDLLLGLWRRVFGSGKRWQEFRKRFGLQYIRALEFTHGSNGWHAHFHVLWLLDKELEPAQLKELEDYAFSQWKKLLAKEGVKEPAKRLFKVELVNDIDAMSHYLEKAAVEVSRQDMKHGKQGSRSPFQILKSAVSGDENDVRLWRDFEQGSKGKRAFTYSRGLRKKYIPEIEEKTDEELAAEDVNGEKVYSLPDGGLSFIRNAGIEPDVRRAVEVVKKPAVLCAALDVLFGPVFESYLLTGDETGAVRWYHDCVHPFVKADGVPKALQPEESVSREVLAFDRHLFDDSCREVEPAQVSLSGLDNRVNAASLTYLKHLSSTSSC